VRLKLNSASCPPAAKELDKPAQGAVQKEKEILCANTDYGKAVELSDKEWIGASRFASSSRPPPRRASATEATTDVDPAVAGTKLPRY